MTQRQASPRSRARWALASGGVGAVVTGLLLLAAPPVGCAPTAPQPADVPAGMVWLPGGRVRMGCTRFYRDEMPVRTVDVAPFAISRHEVTNRQFATFVQATGYKTVAERPLNPRDFPNLHGDQLKPGALVFRQPKQIHNKVDVSQWWAWTPGASWRTPQGPGSTLVDRQDHPVVQIALEDALAYAQWVHQDLPTEAEWEYAARGGLEDADYTWGNNREQRDARGHYMANVWQGRFPTSNLVSDGYERTAPVGSYAANGFGLFDMAGNVWELTKDDYADLRGPQAGMKVAKGGSFLCSDSFCGRYRPAARTPQGADTGMEHVGFRTVWRPAPP